ncbi:hypothetical protein DA83_21965 [Pseudomonas sp. 250J]|nr:hypothetical protein DA83_21965 [Pseudomonas sp. 250J]
MDMVKLEFIFKWCVPAKRLRLNATDFVGMEIDVEIVPIFKSQLEQLRDFDRRHGPSLGYRQLSMLFDIIKQRLA